METTLGHYNNLFANRAYLRSLRGRGFLSASTIAIFAAVSYATATPAIPSPISC